MRQTLERRIGDDLEPARWGQPTHQRHMDNVRGVSGVISDWLQDVVPPHIGMWTYPQRHFERAQQALEATAEGLHTLFTDPARVVDDLAALPGHLRALVENRDALVEAFRRLPPDAQAEAVGRLAGHIEAIPFPYAAPIGRLYEDGLLEPIEQLAGPLEHDTELSEFYMRPDDSVSVPIEDGPIAGSRFGRLRTTADGFRLRPVRVSDSKRGFEVHQAELLTSRRPSNSAR